MNNLISRAKLLSELANRVKGIQKTNPDWQKTHPASVEYSLMELDYIMDKVRDMEEEDAVSVVRCKDCKYRNNYDECPMAHRNYGDGYCGDDEPENYAHDTGFCDYGKRKDEEDNEDDA